MEEASETSTKEVASRDERRVNDSGRAKARSAPVGERKGLKPRKRRAKQEKAAKKARLKYSFDNLTPGQKFTIPHADEKAGKVTVRENVRVLAYEYGKRHGMEFRVERTKSGKVECTRVK